MGFALTPGEAPLHFSRSKNVMHVVHENMFWYRLIWPTIAAIFPTPNSFISTVSVAFAIVLAVFISLSLIGFIADTIIVHPLTKIILKGWDTPHHTN